MFLVDTNVVSELRKARQGKANSNVVRWRVAANASTLYVSAITIHELEIGILLSERRNAANAVALRTWMDAHVLSSYSGRILPVDTSVARRGATLHVPRTRPWADALIAATALVHGMTVVTRNVCDFQSTGVAVLNPWL
ncbi:type II toxin-antitoxin system VapC family toxin [Oxalobacteraceae bacterium OTU3CINTB1]|nr:type II toxin-antitoxin system VapC family toxin [Oxalobacteraceae bacterium OTU3CINTB1]